MIADSSPRALAAAMIGRPLALAPDAAAAAFDLFCNMDFRASATGECGGALKPYEVVDGVATIPVHDQIVSRASGLSDYLGLSAFNRLREALAMAGADPAVRGVILEFDSPGGDVAGATETAAAVRALAAKKPIVAFVDSMATSAAYVIAAATNRIVVTPSATLGSIGVVYMHLDRSAALAKNGVKPTLLHAGKFKVDGNLFAALPDDARRRLQASIDQAHDLIVNSIGLHRPALGAAGARKTEAALFMGQKAVAAGLAEVVGTLQTARALLVPSRPASPPVASASVSRSTPSIGASSMPSRSIPAPVHFEPSSALAAIVSSSQQFSQAAVLKAVKHDEARAKANASVARQLEGKSSAESWRDAFACVNGKASPRAGAAQPTTAEPSRPQTVDELWSDVVAKHARPTAFRGAHR